LYNVASRSLYLKE